MEELLDPLAQRCPYCGETVDLEVDEQGVSHEEYVEDCPVCCRPWTVVVSRGGDSDGIEVHLRREDE